MTPDRPKTIKELLVHDLATKARKLFRSGKEDAAEILFDVGFDLIEPKASKPKTEKSTPPEPPKQE